VCETEIDFNSDASRSIARENCSGMIPTEI